MLDIDWNTIVFHLVLMGVSYLLALPIGWNRERNSRSAGLRSPISTGRRNTLTDIDLGSSPASELQLRKLRFALHSSFGIIALFTIRSLFLRLNSIRRI